MFATDWRQGLPVVRKGGRGQIVDACLKSSCIWRSVELFTLDVNMRVLLNAEDNEFSEYLMRCGDGKLIIDESLGKFKVNVPNDLLFKSTLDDLIDWVYPNISDATHTDLRWTSRRAIICPTNATVDVVNHKTMKKFPGEEIVFRSYDSVETDSYAYPVEFLNTLMPSGLPPHKVILKPGCPIMLMRNMDPHKGHCNGTKYVVTRLHNNIIEAEVSGGAFQGNRIFIPRIKMKPTDGTYPFELTRKQFPVRPCFGITSNKSQGQTLERVGLYIDRPFFSHGQYYVGKSRVGAKSGLRILVTDGVYQGKPGVWTDNVVYPEVLDLSD